MSASFKVTKSEMDTIWQIVDRASRLVTVDRMSLSMDLTAVHANGCPLRLADLLAADDANFLHDVLGIRAHINRKTGKLENCFVPRYSQ